MNNNIYIYQGKPCTVFELAKLSGKSYHFLSDLLKAGWSVEAAVCAPDQQPQKANVAAYAENNNIAILFTEPVPLVFASMQPILRKQYIATPHQGTLPSSKSKLYYTITLENGFPLIVYPGEFTVLRENAEIGA